MKLLFDMYVLLWAAGASHWLSGEARGLTEDPGNAPFFGAASLWEVAVKHALGGEEFRVDPRVLRRGLLENGCVELPVTGAPYGRRGEAPLRPPSDLMRRHGRSPLISGGPAPSVKTRPPTTPKLLHTDLPAQES